MLPETLNDIIKCKRRTDCRCWRPLVIEPMVECPREPECACRYTWCGTHWEKGDAHTLCPVHNAAQEGKG